MKGTQNRSSKRRGGAEVQGEIARGRGRIVKQGGCPKDVYSREARQKYCREGRGKKVGGKEKGKGEGSEKQTQKFLRDHDGKEEGGSWKKERPGRSEFKFGAGH